MTAGLSFDGQVDENRFFESYFPVQEIRGGSGQLKAELAMIRGLFTKGSQASYETHLLGTTYKDISAPS